MSRRQDGLGSGLELVERYEKLRRERRAATRAGRGLTLLLEEGLVGWMDEWLRLGIDRGNRRPATQDHAVQACVPTSSECGSLLTAVQTEMVSVLAELTMNRITGEVRG